VSRHKVRGLIAIPVLAGVAALLVWSVVDLPDFGKYRGPYGYVLNRIAVPQRHTTNVVSSIVFDYRGLDTMGEEFILFASVAGVVLLLRSRGEEKQPEESEEEEDVVDAVESDTLRVLGTLMIAVTLLVGLWLVAFGFVTPGGGFQGGVVVAGALLLVYVATSYRAWRRLTREVVLDPLEASGVGSYAILGLATLLAGAPFLHNFLGPGKSGTLLSGGSLPFLNLATAIEVAAANIVLFSEFLETYVRPLAKRRDA
jgi:multicomponent Na+:H+ antiporter subunit B